MPTVPPPLNETAYRRYMRGAHRMSKIIGMKLHLSGHPRSLQQGQIFVFNHFTRFETSIPPYLIYQHTGAICRSVAYHGLFGIHRALTRFLWDGGCLPSKMPGLLPTLAAEILRGRKVVIFPEGGLVKDKQVLEPTASATGTPTLRKHHKGATVLALYLDIFKAALRDAEARNQTEILTHWQNQLGLPSPQALHEAIHQPTLLVPSTLTFFPLRHEGNFISKTITWLFPNLSDTARDELMTETNLLVRPTDLTVQVGRPLPSGWESLPLPPARLQALLATLHTLDDLFALDKAGPEGWALPQNSTRKNTDMHKALQQATETLRERTARALYGGLTVNIQHLIAGLIHHHFHQGHTHVPVAAFEAALLWAGLRLQQQAAQSHVLALHETLASPEALHRLALGHHAEANAFLHSLQRAKLIRRKGETYHLSSLLGEGLGAEEIRLENPVQLHVNEAAPVPAVSLAIYWGAEQATRMAENPSLWAEMQLEIARQSAYVRYQQAGAHALAAGAGAVAPFFLRPHNTKLNKGVLLLHGLGATPAQMRPLAEDLAAQGYRVYGPALPGHGGKPSDLRLTSPATWLAEARLGVKVLQAMGATEVQVMGFSTGGLLALHLAAEKHTNLHHVVAVAPALKLVQARRHLLGLGVFCNALVAHTLGRVFSRLRYGPLPWHIMHPAFPAEQYNRIPLGTVAQLIGLGNTVRALAPRMVTPITVLHGTADATTHASTSAAFAAHAPRAQFIPIEGGRHEGVRENTHHIWAHISAALARAHTEDGPKTHAR